VLGWDLSLPTWWPVLAPRLEGLEAPLVLATGHLDAAGRRTFAELASTSPRWTCSITHAAWLDRGEVAVLMGLGCVFEVDLYTAVHAPAGRARTDLARVIGELRAAGASVYLTTDAGQLETGDPYRFAEAELDRLVRAVGPGEVEEMARTTPEHLARHVLGEDRMLVGAG
jgi:hypothetical protein